MNISKFVFRCFKSKGFSITEDATDALVSVLAKENDPAEALENILEEIQNGIEKQEIKSGIINIEDIQNVVALMSSSEKDLFHESMQLFNAFSSPKLVYDEKQKNFKMLELALKWFADIFFRDPKPKYEILASVESKANMYRERLLLTQQRLLRSGLFTMKGMKPLNTGNNKHADELSTIDSLLGSVGTKVLFGMLTQPEEGAWYLEDLGSMIRLDLSNAQTYHLLYTEGCQVIVQGELINGVFHVQVMGMPPAEDREASLKSLGIVDPFGNGTRPQQMEQMQAMEVEEHNQLIIIIADVQLDKPAVVEKLQRVFEGFEENEICPLFVLMGSFISKPISRTVGSRTMIQGLFTKLGDIICSCPRISQEAKFLLVPGPIDAGSSISFPRRPIWPELTQSIRERVKHITFGSNPCRVRYFTQEIVLFREDLLKTMQRHLAVPLEVDGGNGPSQLSQQIPDVTEQVVETIIDQGHLCPLPAHARPIFWDLDYTMRIFPLPHLLVLADHADQYTYSFRSCTAVNPGSFSSDYSFVSYHPATKTVEFCKVT